MKEDTEKKLETFIKNWKPSFENNRDVFIRLLDYLRKKEKVTLDFIPRSGVTYSLRAVHANQKKKTLFVMVDVIEDEPRWLSVCFYAEMTTDPEEMGDFVPDGLLGEDAVCFDIERQDDEVTRYIESRIDEACQNAAEG